MSGLLTLLILAFWLVRNVQRNYDWKKTIASWVVFQQKEEGPTWTRELRRKRMVHSARKTRLRVWSRAMWHILSAHLCSCIYVEPLPYISFVTCILYKSGYTEFGFLFLLQCSLCGLCYPFCRAVYLCVCTTERVCCHFGAVVLCCSTTVKPLNWPSALYCGRLQCSKGYKVTDLYTAAVVHDIFTHDCETSCRLFPNLIQFFSIPELNVYCKEIVLMWKLNGSQEFDV